MSSYDSLGVKVATGVGSDPGTSASRAIFGPCNIKGDSYVIVAVIEVGFSKKSVEVSARSLREAEYECAVTECYQ
jgi:hypothetical protein